MNNRDYDSDNLTDIFLEKLAEDIHPDSHSDENPDLWLPQVGAQSMGFYSKADELFYGGAAGGGKGSRGVTKVITPFGYTYMKDLKRGDIICDVDGSEQQVLEIYPQGKKQFYRFTFIDGSTTDVTDDHLWMHWLSRKKYKADRKYLMYSPAKGLRYESVRGRIGVTENLYRYHQDQIQRVKNGKIPNWIIIPLTKPVKYRNQFSEKDMGHKIHPYILGVLLGDGSISGKYPSFASMDYEIVEKFERLLPDDDMLSGNGIIYNIKGMSIRDRLIYFGLMGTRSETKFIPKQYLFASKEDRYQLCQGLIDSDGYVDTRGHIEYTTVSYQLAQDVRHLFMSMGCKVTITEKEEPYYINQRGEKVICQKSYRLYIRGKNTSKMVYLPRKKERCKDGFNGGVSEYGRRVISIEKVDIDDAYCIAVSHPKSLYMVDDFIVTHNTDLLVGLSTSRLSPHKKAIVFRSSYPEHKDFIERVKKVTQDHGGEFKAGNQMKFVGIPGGKTLELGSVVSFQEAQKYRGRAHDLKMFDELPLLSESVYTFLIGWARTTEKGVPVRVVSTGNPPTDAAGLWIVRRWAPWLDPDHAEYPFPPGELKWYANLNGDDTEITPEINLEGSQGKPFMFTHNNGKEELIIPKSRTFVPSLVGDNKYLGQEYIAQLQSMPEPYRSQMLYGDFGLSKREDPFQVIPSQWVKAAQERWKEMEKSGALDRIKHSNPVFGIDVAEGAKDFTVFVKMTNNVVQWVNYTQTPDTMGQFNEFMNLSKYDKNAPIGIDAIGVGRGFYDRLKESKRDTIGIKVSRKASRREPSGLMFYYNLRCQLWWELRLAFDPAGKSPLAIPPDKKLYEDLVSVKYQIHGDNIWIQNKDEIRTNLGRSPDSGEALMFALYVANRRSTPLRIV